MPSPAKLAAGWILYGGKVIADYLEDSGRPDEAHRQRLWADFYRRMWPRLANEL
jgi:hypothetical protein